MPKHVREGAILLVSFTGAGGAWTGRFEAAPTQAESKGYLAATQTLAGMIHLISSRLQYRFNQAWIETPAKHVP